MKKIFWILVWIIGLVVITYFAYVQNIDNIKTSSIDSINKQFKSEKLTNLKVSFVEGESFLPEYLPSSLFTKNVVELKGNISRKSDIKKAKEIVLNEFWIGKVETSSLHIEKSKPKNPFVSRFMLEITKDSNENIKLSGFANTDNMLIQLSHKANNFFGNVQNDVKVANGAPANFHKLSFLGLEVLKNAKEGSFKIIRNKYVADLVVLSNKEKKLIEKKLSVIPLEMSNFRGKLNITTIEKEEEKVEDIDMFSSPVIEPHKAKEIEFFSKSSKKIEEIFSKKKECQSFIDSTLLEKYIQFAYKKTTLKGNKSDVLDTIIEKLKKCDLNSIYKVEIAGHTDSIGSAKYNKKLSQKRADSVKKYMQNKGIKSSKLKAVGYGEVFPIASNKTKSGQAKNRRIEIKILEKK